MPVLIRIALRNLLEHKAKSLIIGIIVAIGVIILVVGNSFMDTAALGIKRSFIANFTGNVMISGKASGPVSLFGVQSAGTMEETPIIPDYDKLISYLQSQKEVASFTSQITGFAVIGTDSDQNTEDGVFTLLFGIDPASYHAMFDNVDFVAGGYLEPGQEGILLSADRVKDIEKNLKTKVTVGDKILLNSVGSAGMHIRQVTIRGIYNFKQKTEALDLISYVDAQTLRALLGLTVASTKITNLPKSDTSLLGTSDADALFGGGDMVQADTSATAPISEHELNTILGETGAAAAPEQLNTGAWHFILLDLKNPNDAPAFIVKTNAWLSSQGISADTGDWKKAADGFASISDVIRTVFNVAILIVAVVAVIIIMNTLMISVIERTAEIGTMRALGAQKSFVWRMFVIETLTISIVFGAIGMVLGSAVIGVLNLVGIHASNSFLQILFAGPVLRPSVSLSSLVSSLIVVVVIGIVAHLYPVSIALKIEPVKAIQTE